MINKPLKEPIHIGCWCSPTPTVILSEDYVPDGYDTNIARLMFLEKDILTCSLREFVHERYEEDKFPNIIHINDDYALLEYGTDEECEAFFKSLLSVADINSKYADDLQKSDYVVYLYFDKPFHCELYEFNRTDSKWYLVMQDEGYVNCEIESEDEDTFDGEDAF